jgi:hypothetical protein
MLPRCLLSLAALTNTLPKLHSPTFLGGILKVLPYHSLSAFLTSRLSHMATSLDLLCQYLKATCINLCVPCYVTSEIAHLFHPS